MSPSPRITSRHVVVVGGGIAGLEALLLLGDRGERGLRLTLLSDRDRFVLRPQMIGEPWGGPAVRADLRLLTHEAGAFLAHQRLVAVVADRSVAVMASGAEVPYDDLVIATGATPTLPYTGAQTVGFGSLPSALTAAAHGSVAIVVPPGTGWTLPAYQLALHIAAETPGRVTVMSPERAPLEVFGDEVATTVAQILDRYGVATQYGIELPPGSDVRDLADVVLALPLLQGPAIGGMPTDGDGYHPVDEHQRVAGMPGVYVVGDATPGRIKQGGLAALQADAAAAHIAHLAGASVPPEPYVPILRGKLVACGETLYLRRNLDGSDPGRCSAVPLWQPPGLLCAWRLVRWLDQHRDQLEGDPLEPLSRGAQA